MSKRSSTFNDGGFSNAIWLSALTSGSSIKSSSCDAAFACLTHYYSTPLIVHGQENTMTYLILGRSLHTGKYKRSTDRIFRSTIQPEPALSAALPQPENNEHMLDDGDDVDDRLRICGHVQDIRLRKSMSWLQKLDELTYIHIAGPNWRYKEQGLDGMKWFSSGWSHPRERWPDRSRGGYRTCFEAGIIVFIKGREWFCVFIPWNVIRPWCMIKLGGVRWRPRNTSPWVRSDWGWLREVRKLFLLN